MAYAITRISDPERRLVALEVLNSTLVSLRRFSGAERAEISSSSRLGILFAGIQAVASGLQFSDQWGASRQVAVTTTPSQTNFPSARCTHGRVKLCTLIFMQRRGTTKLARLGTIHPVARVQTIRINAVVVFRELADRGGEACLLSVPTSVFFTSLTSIAMI